MSSNMAKLRSTKPLASRFAIMSVAAEKVCHLE
jgi:hypothetical protein